MKQVFPAGPPADGGCDEWCAPLHLIEKLVSGQVFAKYFDPDDLMIMMRLEDSRGSITLYKHRDTRRYLNVDDAGHVYRYAPGSRKRGRRGDYLVLDSLPEAMQLLGLWELPWFREEFAADRLGLEFEERWRHPLAPAFDRRSRPLPAPRR